VAAEYGNLEAAILLLDRGLMSTHAPLSTKLAWEGRRQSSTRLAAWGLGITVAQLLLERGLTYRYV